MSSIYFGRKHNTTRNAEMRKSSFEYTEEEEILTSTLEICWLTNIERGLTLGVSKVSN